MVYNPCVKGKNCPGRYITFVSAINNLRHSRYNRMTCTTMVENSERRGGVVGLQWFCCSALDNKLYDNHLLLNTLAVELALR